MILQPETSAMAVLLSAEQALHFARDLRHARVTALADSEGWQSLVFVFERLVKFCAGDQSVTIGDKKAKVEFKRLVVGVCSDQTQEYASFNMLLEQVIQGRNSEFHGGAAARRFAKHCVEFSLLLEEGLSHFMNKNLGSVMSSPVVEIKPWQMLVEVRRLMLENSYTWIPLKTESGWHVVSDLALVTYFKKYPMAWKTQKIKDALGAEAKLETKDLLIFNYKTEIGVGDETLMKALALGPVLVGEGDTTASDRVIGIVTAFDLL